MLAHTPSRLLTFCYCLFIVLASVLIMAALSVIIPLRNNIAERIDNHITSRELHIQFAYNVDKETISDICKEISAVEHVSKVYRDIYPTNMTDSDGAPIVLNAPHLGADLEIIAGRNMKKNERGVIIAPEFIGDKSGLDLLGKTLTLTDALEREQSFKVVGVYHCPDEEAQSGFLINRAELDKVNNDIKKHNGSLKNSGWINYTILVDHARNSEAVWDYVNTEIIYTPEPTVYDGEIYRTALYALCGLLAVFAVLVYVGFYFFLRNNINSRTSELALYRAIGYKTRHIFRVIFIEHIFFGVISIVIGTVVAGVLCSLVLNPTAAELLGNTLMEMTVFLNPISVVFCATVFVLMICAVCRRAVKRSEKLDLTVLLREN